MYLKKFGIFLYGKRHRNARRVHHTRYRAQTPFGNRMRRAHFQPPGTASCWAMPVEIELGIVMVFEISLTDGRESRDR